MMINMGLVFMMSLNGSAAKYIASGMYLLGCTLLFMEFNGKPEMWTIINHATFILIGLNSLMIINWLDKCKINKNASVDY